MPYTGLLSSQIIAFKSKRQTPIIQYHRISRKYRIRFLIKVSDVVIIFILITIQCPVDIYISQPVVPDGHSRVDLNGS